MRRRWWIAILSGLVSLVAALLYAAWPGRSTFTVSPETTYVTGPLDNYGNVDYVAALNERLRGNITPEQNANVLIWQALGPKPEGGNGMPPEYFTWLGIDPPPEQGEYLISYHNYQKERRKDDFSAKFEEFNDQQSRAAKWPWRAADEPDLADWLKRNEKPLALVIQATQRPQYYNPLVPRRAPGWCGSLLDSLLPNVQKCREVANALACRALLRVSNGETDAAWQDLLACHRLGRLLTRGQGTLIELLVGIAVEQVASRADIVFLESKSLSSVQILACLRDLRNLPPLPNIGEKLDLTERFMCLNSILLVASEGSESLSGSFSTPPKPRSFPEKLFTPSINWDLALKNANQIFDRCAVAGRATDRAERAKKQTEIAVDVSSAIQRAKGMDVIQKAVMGPKKRGEAVGDILMGLLLPAFDKVESSIDRCDQIQRNLHLAFAAYRRDRGTYPAVLADLAPKYLDAIPDDLFSGKSLIYQPAEKGYLLYSFGENGLDDGGQAWDDDPRGDDLVVRVPVLEPRAKK